MRALSILLLSASLFPFAGGLAAQPQASRFVQPLPEGEEALTPKVAQVVRAAYYAVAGDDYFFDATDVILEPITDRVDARPVSEGLEQRRRAAVFALTDLRYARALLAAHYVGEVRR